MRLNEFEFPDDLKYMKGHIWIRIEGDEAVVGLTSFGSSLTKEIVHIDMPENNTEFKSMEPMASFETIKSVNEIHAPFNCRVIEVNEKLFDNPSLINSDPYGDGWILRLKIIDNINMGNLMDVNEAVGYYKKILIKEKERYKGIYD